MANLKIGISPIGFSAVKKHIDAGIIGTVRAMRLPKAGRSRSRDERYALSAWPARAIGLSKCIDHSIKFT
jgi:hypothetical protein